MKASGRLHAGLRPTDRRAGAHSGRPRAPGRQSTPTPEEREHSTHVAPPRPRPEPRAVASCRQRRAPQFRQPLRCECAVPGCRETLPAVAEAFRVPPGASSSSLRMSARSSLRPTSAISRSSEPPTGFSSSRRARPEQLPGGAAQGLVSRTHRRHLRAHVLPGDPQVAPGGPRGLLAGARGHLAGALAADRSEPPKRRLKGTLNSDFAMKGGLSYWKHRASPADGLDSVCQVASSFSSL